MIFLAIAYGVQHPGRFYINYQYLENQANAAKEKEDKTTQEKNYLKRASLDDILIDDMI